MAKFLRSNSGAAILSSRPNEQTDAERTLEQGCKFGHFFFAMRIESMRLEKRKIFEKRIENKRTFEKLL